MDHFQDIRVLPDPEFSDTMLMAALFAKLHRALGARNRGDIGVSFPQHNTLLGNVMRLHGTQAALTELEAMAWRKGLRDYCETTAVMQVPEKVQYRTVSRVQVKSSAARLMRRSVRKGWLTAQEAEQKRLVTDEQRTSLPFIAMNSLSTGQAFRLFIRHGEPGTQAIAGDFSSYGLSASATIPWF
ncbi:CRISPR-associated protein Csy4 [[Pantoea] beijingensis]|uniref:CRISPR-associated protein Csy4 n=1 Tax=[Pantoea] beijingensis TaxID=1324864 RepID=A0A443I8X8_9GAMM|nr:MULTISPECIES: type I-F CRISPR-associated endoribonuclease Cas6/Csy4 [Erwiniaceae]RWR00500.1 CRISPR-associated protein Csy4 [[Pantoea] beijingensis]